MAGNVTEWVADWYGESTYMRGSRKDPAGPKTGRNKVARGGAWDSNINLYARSGYRYQFPPNTISAAVGFRCAGDVKKE
jgi:formylglycine-generating enzyme required for sulfatase activity